MAQRSYTSITDPDWNYRHLNRMNEVLGAFQQAMMARKERQEARAYENAELALKAVERGADPSDPAIRSSMGPLAKLNPDLAAIYQASLDAAAGERGKKASGDAAYQRMIEGAEQERQAIAMMQQLGGAASFGGNPAAGHALMNAGAFAQENPPTTAGYLQSAMGKMSIQDQLAALPQVQRAGIDMNMAAPSQFDPYGGDLPPAAAGLLAGQQGLIGGDPVQALRYQTALDRSPQQLAAQGIAEQQLAQGQQRIGLSERQLGLTSRGLDISARRLALDSSGGPKDDKERAKAQREAVRGRAAEIRQEHNETQAHLDTSERAAPPKFGQARQQAARQIGGELSPRLGAALDQMGVARDAVIQKITATSSAALEGDKGAVRQNQRLAELVEAMDKAERDVLTDIAAGKDPEIVASLIEQLLQALQQ